MNEEILELQREISALKARFELEDLVSDYLSYLSACMGEEILERFWLPSDACSIEFGASGVYEGYDKVATFYQKDKKPGSYSLYSASSPKLEITGGSEARGVWTLFGVELDAGDLGPAKARDSLERQTLSTCAPCCISYKADWVWQKAEFFFVKTDGGWKIKGLHIYDLLRTPFGEDWVAHAKKRFRTDGQYLDWLFTSNVPYPPGVLPENHASRETSFHWQYTADSVPPLIPPKDI